MKDFIKFLLGLSIGIILGVIIIAGLNNIFSPKPIERDRYDNDLELTKEIVIMGDNNALTVAELIEVYSELYH